MSENTPLDLLREWIFRQLQAASAGWLREKVEQLSEAARDRDLYLAISLVPSKIGKEDLRLEASDLAAAEGARSGWRPGGWSVDQAARLILLLSAKGSDAQFAERLEQLCTTADVGELITFYRGLPLYPAQERYVARASEGARTNMKAVFEAVAHHNPYPAEQFGEAAWNQMVLKALFVGSTLNPIQRIDERRNPDQMRMLCDYAHERWAAGRDVSPEIWRGVGPFADEAALADLERALASDHPLERQGAALALRECPDPKAARLLGSVPDMLSKIESGGISWDTVYQNLTNPID
ncbi:MAG: EboA domain-containing protein [Kiloniellaceae bacterium]